MTWQHKYGKELLKNLDWSGHVRGHGQSLLPTQTPFLAHRYDAAGNSIPQPLATIYQLNHGQFISKTLSTHKPGISRQSGCRNALEHRCAP